MQERFDSFKNFNIENAGVRLWVFKHSQTEAKFRAWFVRSDEDLSNTLRSFARAEQDRIDEHSPYTFISQTNEAGCLCIEENETDFNALKILVDRPELDHAVDKVERLRGASGYLVKFTHEGNVLYATRRSPRTWKTGYRKKNILNVIFNDGVLSASEGEEFTLEPGFDLFCIDGAIFISDKRGFENLLRHRTAYARAFGELQDLQEFKNLFTNMQPLIDYVGSNAMHLRRMGVVYEKGLYNSPDFLPAVKQVSVKYGWPIEFDANTGQIIPTEESASLIVKLLLDQRLMSEITNIMYDVPDGVPVE